MAYVVHTSNTRSKEGFQTLSAARAYAAQVAHRQGRPIEIDQYNLRGNLGQHHALTVPPPKQAPRKATPRQPQNPFFPAPVTNRRGGNPFFPGFR